MRKLLKFSVLLLAVLLIFSFAGCDDGGSSGSDVEFESFTPPSIYVDNKSGENLVAFKGSLEPKTLISGIPAFATNHGLKKDPALFGATGDFALILLTEDEYIKNKKNPAAANVFAEIYAFYNHEATNNNRFQISSKSGGTGKITLNNGSAYNIEIRRDGSTGEVMGYVAPNMTNTVLRVYAPDDYSLYPVLKRYIPSEKEIYEAIPRYKDGDLVGLPYAREFALPLADTALSWNLAEAVNMATIGLTSGCFYLRITNNSSDAIRFFRGDEEQATSMGIKSFGPSATEVFQIKLTRNPDRSYPEKETFSQLSIGVPRNSKTIPSQEFKLDYIYTITVTGNASSLILGTITESAEPIDVEAKFGFQ